MPDEQQAGLDSPDSSPPLPPPSPEGNKKSLLLLALTAPKQLIPHIQSRFGRWGMVVLAFILLAVFVWWNWSKIRTQPGVTQVVEVLFHQKPLPTVEKSRFSIAVANLENDTERRYGNLLVQRLREQFPNILVVRVDRMLITFDEELVLEQAEQKGNARARKYLEKAGADVLIGGRITRLEDTGPMEPKLYWTVSGETDHPKTWGRYVPEGLALPAIFWNDLVDVLELLVVTQDSALKEVEGQYDVTDRLRPFVGKVRQLLRNSEGQPGWNPESRATTRIILARSLQVLGEQTRKREPLEEAETELRAALRALPRERSPLLWATAQHGLGNALGTLSHFEEGTEYLEEAVVAFQAALSVWTREYRPLEWAKAQSSLGKVLGYLGEREESTARLEEAVTAYQAALLERPREREPLLWASTQYSLGTTLGIFGEREGGTAHLKEAVVALRAALEIISRESAPLSWAHAQNSLGNTLALLGEREKSTAYLQEAVTAFRASLIGKNRERDQTSWALTQFNLGNALKSLGTLEGEIARIKEAEAAYRAALEVFSKEDMPLDWADAQHELGNALRLHGERTEDSMLLCEALTRNVAAQEVFVQESISSMRPDYVKVVRGDAATITAALQGLGGSQASRQCLEKRALDQVAR